ncbi:MAG: demethoxyubiquinone hydroxylase family protein, partial [Rhodospirillales bacterium]|nr:demethoxyubiquinone hydroxylase family protein [Rhodospirillales bacterium]
MITPTKTTGDGRLPGDPDAQQLVERMIRVDHAGEYGAVRIYEGQMAVLGGAAAGGAIARMAEQERDHLAAFEKLVRQRCVRPTVLTPLWYHAGFALGAATAALGPHAAMACT